MTPTVRFDFLTFSQEVKNKEGAWECSEDLVPLEFQAYYHHDNEDFFSIHILFEGCESWSSFMGITHDTLCLILNKVIAAGAVEQGNFSENVLLAEIE